MEAFNKIQFDTSTAITRARTNFKKSPKERITLNYIEVRLEHLEKQWTLFNDAHYKILQEVEETEYHASKYYSKNLYQTTEEIYFDYKIELKEMLTQLKPMLMSHSTTKASDKSYDVKLPKICLPIFSGNYSEWISFRDLFISLIHSNSKLDDVQKLHYLKTHLSGEAESLLRHIPITSSNYSTCWSQLEGRYNNTKYLANCILKRFMNQRNIVTESAHALKELLDTSNECLHALTNLGISVVGWDIILIYILSLKLDNESRKQWELKISDSSNQLPTFQQFQGFIEQRFRALEFLDNNKVHRNVTLQRNVASVKAHSVSTVLSYSYCQENHKIANYKKFCQQDVDTRRNFVQTNGLCFNCLGINHSVYSCRQSTRCRLCKRKHHTLLHSINISKPVNEEDTAVRGNEKDITTALSINPPQSESTDIVSCFSNSQGQVLLATALVKAQSQNGTTIVLRSLLDQGSQASFVTESMVQLLGLERIPIRGKITGIGGDQCQSLTSNSMVVMQVQSRVDPTFVVTVKAYVLKRLTTLLPQKKIMTQVLTTISSMELADPSFATPNKI